MNIELKVDDRVVSGRIVSRSYNKISVQLVQPYGGLTAVAQIPEFAQPYKRFDDTYGERRAESLLNELYQIASYAHGNRMMLSAILQQVLRRVEQLAEQFPDQREFAAEKRILERQRSEGKFDDAGMLLRMSNLGKAHAVYKKRVSEEINRFFGSAFPMPVPIDCQEQVLGLIAKERPLADIDGDAVA